jgi:chlorobactene glucosyltransferase
LTVLIAILAGVNLLVALRGMSLARKPVEVVVGCPHSGPMPRLSIVVPARNEQRQIENCVESLLAQRYADFEVVVVDDCSEDQTPAILQQMASANPRLRVVHGETLPAGWVGKPWALEQGARVADGRWLLFTDADTVHDPDGAASAVAAARASNVDVLSLLTEQDLGTLSERMLMPSLFLAILDGTGPIGDVGDKTKSDVALFNGQYILTSRTAYAALGGHAAVRNEIAEDLELARRFKRDGRFRIALAASKGVARTRMYRSLREIWDGFVKNFALGIARRPAWATLGILALACVSPLSPLILLLLLASVRWGDAVALASSLALVLVVASYRMRSAGLPRYAALWLPIGTAFVVAVSIASVLLYASGRGVWWRGRRYGGGFGRA